MVRHTYKLLGIPLFLAATINPRRVVAVLLLGLLAGCTAVPEGQEFLDPHEESNRRSHEFNRGVDRILLRPSSQAYGAVIPQPVKRGIGNLASNLDQPRFVVNDLLQGEIEDAGHNTFRFLINTIVGIGGIFDPATSMGLPVRETDFGQTLHVWGAEEGHYMEIPFIGPSTARDAVGIVVDVAMNPVSYVFSGDDALAVTVVGAASTVGDRYQFSDFIDSVLYESEDSYAQSRLLYLQNRRFELGTAAENEEDYFDPFEDEFLQ